jgi:hypothetical protein
MAMQHSSSPSCAQPSAHRNHLRTPFPPAAEFSGRTLDCAASMSVGNRPHLSLMTRERKR